MANVLENDTTEISRSTHPWVTFTVNAQNYCISSEFVIQMIIKCTVTPVPHSPTYNLGIANVRGENFPIIDLRNLFGLNTLEESIDAFSSMKEKHLNWISKLEECMSTGAYFDLPRNPSKCSFGLWYENFSTENISINYILGKIDKPHKEMHIQADIIDTCKARGDMAGANAAFERAQYLCQQVIVPLLDSLIEAYITATKGMIILLKKDEKKLGLLADNITSIESFEGAKKNSSALQDDSSEYVENIIYTGDDRVFLEIDTDAMFSLTNSL